MAALKKPFPGSHIVLSLGLIVSSVVYAAWRQTAGQESAVSPSQQFKDANEAFLQTLLNMPAAEATNTPTAGPRMMGRPMMRSGAYVDGAYTGNPMDAYYGTVQVKAVIRNGFIADVQFLQYPDSRQNSVFINSQAMPLLTQEAIVAQNAQVSGVSGATFTSQAFEQSLASALVLARK
ncbi:MAG: FMN-binding protein [Candidatus Pacebacteria bacterium]|nr:FMN-binding protein [Candidatus Paceibacterota bacterium]